MSKPLTFYTNPMSRGRIARWALEEAGADYRTEILEYGGSMKSAEYLAINPMGKVPAIKHGDTVVTECAAICAYIADAFPAANLAPAPEARGDYYRWLFYFTGPVEAAVINRSLAVDVPEDKKMMVGYGAFDEVMDTVEAALSNDGYIAGDAFTAADVYAGSQIGWGLQFGTIDKRPAFERYFEKLCGRAAYKKAQMLDDEAMPAQTDG